MKLFEQAKKILESEQSTCDCCHHFEMDNIPMMDNLLYFLIDKGVLHELVYISPKEYLLRISKGFKQSYEETMGSAYDDNLANKYAKSMAAGDKFPVGYYRDNRPDQEGRHRAAAAMKLGCQKIPVIKITNVTQDYIRDFVISNKSATDDDLNNLVKAKGGEEITDLDLRAFRNYIEYRL